MKIFLIGFMGSGKTYQGRQLSKQLGIPFFDLDEQIENQHGKTVTELFAQYGEEQLRILEKETLYLITESHDSFVMACGGGTPCFFNNIDYLNATGITIWLNTGLDVITQRLIKGKNKRPLIKDIPDKEIRTVAAKKMIDRKIYYEQAKYHFTEETTDTNTIINTLTHG